MRGWVKYYIPEQIERFEWIGNSEAGVPTSLCGRYCQFHHRNVLYCDLFSVKLKETKWGSRPCQQCNDALEETRLYQKLIE